MNKNQTAHEIEQIANLATLPYKNKKDLRDALKVVINNLVIARSRYVVKLTRSSLRQHPYESDENYINRLRVTIYGE